MPPITFPLLTVDATCDRCGAHVLGYRQDALTAGFYDVTHPRWRVFAQPGEYVLCARCLETDSFYMASYVSLATDASAVVTGDIEGES